MNTGVQSVCTIIFLTWAGWASEQIQCWELRVFLVVEAGGVCGGGGWG